MGRNWFRFVDEAPMVKAALGRRSPYAVSGVLGMVVVIGCGSIVAGGPQDSNDACAPVHAAYQKMQSASNSSNATNTGALNVTDAYDRITSEAGHKETCKYLRDETLAGEPANVYSDVFTSKSGTATGTVWISKKNFWTLKQEVDVDMGDKGKGHRSIVFQYPKK
jgi:hypothetical protein